MYAGQYRNNPIIDDSLSFSKLISAIKTILKPFKTPETHHCQFKNSTHTALLIAPLNPYLTVASSTKVKSSTLLNK